MMRTRLGLVLLAPIALTAQTPDSGAFLITLGADTIIVERYTRTGDQLVDDMVLRDRTPTVLRHYVATLRPDGSIARLELDAKPAAGAAGPALHGVATFTTEETFFEITRDGQTRRATVVTPAGALPFFNNSYTLYEQIGRRARTLGKGPVKISVIGFGDSSPFDLTVAFPAADSLTVGFGVAAPTLMRVDATGRVLGADGRLTTQKVIVTRLPALDVGAFAARFAGRALGTLSPPDSVRAEVVGARIAIDYSRPAMRGRKIFGAVVPWDSVWRTGANAATRFTTSADLVIGGKTIPKGTYTLWTLPSPAGWKLIVNSQTKAPCQGSACMLPTRRALWGTDYAADSDFVRLDLHVEQLTRPVEQFTIAVAPQDNGAVLRMEWETTRVSIPFTRKPQP